MPNSPERWVIIRAELFAQVGSAVAVLKSLFCSVRIFQYHIPHGSESWRVCILLSASIHANLRPRKVCVRESNRVQAAHRDRNIRIGFDYKREEAFAQSG
jgi:hypothetical protein